MEREEVVFPALVGFHSSLVLYFLVTGSRDLALHYMIFLSGVLAILLFAFSKVMFESRFAFLATIAMLVTTFVSSTMVVAGGSIFRWLIVVLYNIAQTRTMRVVDVQKVAKRNIIINTLLLALNIIYEVVT